MSGTAPSTFIDTAKGLASRIQAAAQEIEQTRRLPMALVEAMAQTGLFRLWIPRTLGGEETDPMTLVRVVEEVSRADGAVGWCMAIGGEYGALGGYLPADAAREIYGSDPHVRTAGAFRPFGNAVAVDGGYRVTGRWPLGSGCQHSAWIVGGCRILDGDRPRCMPDGTPITRILFFPASDCEILDTWDSIGLRGTGSHDYAVADVFVPAQRALSFRERPTEPGPLYAMPTIALFGAVLAAVPLGIARHAIDILMELAGTKIASRSRQALREDVTMQTSFGARGSLITLGASLSLRGSRRRVAGCQHRANVERRSTRHALAGVDAGCERSQRSDRAYVQRGRLGFPLHRQWPGTLRARHTCGGSTPHCRAGKLSDGRSGAFGLRYAIHHTVVHGRP